jgi:long-chain acyl-CoA synthetase
MKPTRLFDFLAYQSNNFSQSDALAAKEQGKWRTYSTDKCLELSHKVSKGLLALGVEPGDNVAMVSTNRPEWNFVDHGILQIGAVNVPLYPNISKQEYKYILEHSEAKYIFVGNKELYDKVKPIVPEVETLEGIYTFDEIQGAPHWKEVIKAGKDKSDKEVEQLKEKVESDDLATIIYTSGTTGTPKGVMLTHHNIVSNVNTCTPLLPIDEQCRALSFLPLNHVFERMITYLYMANGISIYYAQSKDTIADDLKEVAPHIFTSVPRLLEKVYEKIVSKGMALSGIKRALFFWALRLGLNFDFDRTGWLYQTELKIANKLIFSKWREALGGNVKAIVSGGAALQPRLARVFTAAGIPIMEGYGLTETSPVIAVNRFEEKDRKFGTVGPIIDGIEVKIADDGEILTRGPHVMKGYYKQPELTKEEIDEEGWFPPGDIGEFENDRFLKITDRKKQVFKTSGGKYVAPQPLENKFKESMLIEQIMVVGEKRKFVSALIAPSFENLKEWCKKKSIEVDDKKSMIEHPKVKAKFDEIVDELNQNFSHTEQIKKYVLVPDEWDVSTGELTPTLKVKRRAIMKKYEDVIENEIYNE